MADQTVNQRVANRNQSTADYQTKKICIWDNRFLEGTFVNNTGGSLTLVPGMMVARHATLANTFIPLVAGSLANFIGIAVQEGSIVLADAGTVNINIVVAGTVDGTQLTPPATTTLDTVQGGKSLEDIINAVGLHIDRSAVEQTKFDN